MGSQRRDSNNKHRKSLKSFFLFPLLGGTLFSCTRSDKESPLSLSSWQRSPFFQHIVLEKDGFVKRQKKLRQFDVIFTKLIDEKYSTYALGTWEAKNVENLYPDFKAFIEICGHHSQVRPIVATVTPSQEDVDIACQLLQCIFYSFEDPSLKEFFTLEALAKVLAYRDCKKGQRIPLAQRNAAGSSQLVNYRVDEVFDLGSGIPAFGLIPEVQEDYPPILLFRGSEFSLNKRGRKTILANLDLKGPGYKMYQEARSCIRSWLEKQVKIYGKTHVLGFSLGGILASYAAFYEKEFIAHAYAFNMPGVTKKFLKEWALEHEKPLFHVYVNRGDPVSKIGNLIGHVVECSFPYQPSAIQAHNLLLLGEEKITLSTVDIESENASKRILKMI